jgi:hypothetical protein
MKMQYLRIFGIELVMELVDMKLQLRPANEFVTVVSRITNIWC